MRREIPAEYLTHLTARRDALFGTGRGERLSWRAFWVGAGLSVVLAVGAPYGNMIIRGSYMALDFSTPGAIFLFLLLIGLLNSLLKIAARSRLFAGAAAAAASVAWLSQYADSLASLDIHSPGLQLSCFLVATAWVNVPVVLRGSSMALNRSELVLVYAMLLVVSALCTMGLSEQLLPILTAVFYYASPQNEWQARLFPHLPRRALVDDGAGNRLFYEGLSRPQDAVAYGAWVEPLLWWGVFLVALYVTMVCVAVIVRRQWMERERLAYPIAQVGLSMIRAERGDRLVNGFFRQPGLWLGAALPLVAGSLRALHTYDPGVPVPPLQWTVPFVGRQTLQLAVSFAMLGFSYFANANIAASIWLFHLLSKAEKEALTLAGVKSSQQIDFGVSDHPFLGYQGLGALLALVLVGLWVGREHYGAVVGKALGRAPQVEDGDEILPYRGAVGGAAAGVAVMSAWLWFMGTPLWASVSFVIVALLVFLGVTRIVAEAGLASVRAPMIAGDLLVQGVGSAAIGPAGVVNLSLAYIWAADIRVFVMATATNALKMIEEMDPRRRRVVFWAMVLALLIGALGSCWMIFHMAYRHGGINLNSWFFQGLPTSAYSAAARNLEPRGACWLGLGFLAGGGAAMAVLMWLRLRLPWWPVHPVGFPVGANDLMDFVWFNVFLAWLLKRLVLRYGGASAYTRSQPFFLGLIAGQVTCNGGWLVIDYFTGKVGNAIFWI